MPKFCDAIDERVLNSKADGKNPNRLLSQVFSSFRGKPLHHALRQWAIHRPVRRLLKRQTDFIGRTLYKRYDVEVCQTFARGSPVFSWRAPKLWVVAIKPKSKNSSFLRLEQQQDTHVLAIRDRE